MSEVWHPVAVLIVVALLGGGCSAASERGVERAEERLAEQLDADGERGLDVQIDPDTTIIRVEDPASGDVFVDGDGQDRPGFLDPSIPLPPELEITWSSVQQGITQVEGELPPDAAGSAQLTRLYDDVASRLGWAVEGEPTSLLGEQVIILAYLLDGTPLDVRVDGTTFTLLVGRYWESPNDGSEDG